MKSNGLFSTVFVFLTLMILTTDSQGQVAIVVNPDSPVSDLEFKELRAIYLGKTTMFADDLPIVLGSQKEFEKQVFRQLLDMTPLRVRRYWIKSVFAGSRAHPPESMSSPEQVKEFISENPGAIAFLDVSEVDETVNVVAIDGLKPGQSGYQFN